LSFGVPFIMAAPSITTSCKVVLANGVAKSLLEEVREGLSKLPRKPVLVGFLANDDPAGKMYADWSAKTCTEK
jgi:methylenetetrahydrofolate dehydrogenase (NAD+)